MSDRKFLEILFLPVIAFRAMVIVTMGCSNLKIHSIGHLTNSAIPISWPKVEVISETVTNSWTTINQPEKFMKILEIRKISKKLLENYLVAIFPWLIWTHLHIMSDTHETNDQIDSQDVWICKSKIPKAPYFEMDFGWLPMILTNMDLKRLRLEL